MIKRHVPAFKDQIKELFLLKKGSSFLDLTLGDGGHTQEALEAGSKVVSLDVDPESIERARHFIGDKYLKSGQWRIENLNFNRIFEIANKYPQFDAAIADLGTSQYHLEKVERGFSFESDAMLDMRLDPSLGVTVADLLAALSEKEIKNLLEIVDESYAWKIAKIIINTRRISPIVSTTQLRDLILQVKPRVSGKSHPATKTFMALRMAVNLERESLSTMLEILPNLIKKNGHIGIISFHSGEDRIVKKAFNQWFNSGVCISVAEEILVPTNDEIINNQKIRSAKLRICQKNQ